MPTIDPTQLPHVMAFRGAYGRLCTMAAIALKWQECSKEAVRYALGGQGEHLGLAHVREQRTECNRVLDDAMTALGMVGVQRGEALEMCVAMAREARIAVESEWGHSAVPGSEPAPWDHLALPVVQVR